MDGRTISVPLAWSWRLSEATAKQRANWEIIGDGHGVHWPDIGEDISAEGMLYSVPARRPPKRLLSKTMTWVHLARLDAARFASPFLIRTFPGIWACLTCLVRGTTRTVRKLLLLMESRCTMMTVFYGSEPEHGQVPPRKTSPG